MTVCVGIAVHDGIVFAADSATTLEGIDAQGNQAVINVYRNGNKVFNLVRGLPIVAMTCGMGNMAKASIATLSKDFRVEAATAGSQYHIDRHNYTMSDVADKVYRFFEAKYDALNPPPANPHGFEYFLAGYDTTSTDHQLWKFGFSNGQKIPPFQSFPTGECGIVWGGSGGEPIHRLVLGHAPKLKPAFVAAGLNQQTADQLFNVAAADVKADLAWDPMPIQDAIELADFLTDAAKRYVRFLPGADTVGGEIDIAVVTRHERFKWVRRKHYYPVDLNPLETDHA